MPQRLLKFLIIGCKLWDVVSPAVTETDMNGHGMPPTKLSFASVDVFCRQETMAHPLGLLPNEVNRIEHDPQGQYLIVRSGNHARRKEAALLDNLALIDPRLEGKQLSNDIKQMILFSSSHVTLAFSGCLIPGAVSRLAGNRRGDPPNVAHLESHDAFVVVFRGSRIIYPLEYYEEDKMESMDDHTTAVPHVIDSSFADAADIETICEDNFYTASEANSLSSADFDSSSGSGSGLEALNIDSRLQLDSSPSGTDDSEASIWPFACERGKLLHLRDGDVIFFVTKTLQYEVLNYFGLAQTPSWPFIRQQIRTAISGNDGNCMDKVLLRFQASGLLVGKTIIQRSFDPPSNSKTAEVTVPHHTSNNSRLLLFDYPKNFENALQANVRAFALKNGCRLELYEDGGTKLRIALNEFCKIYIFRDGQIVFSHPSTDISHRCSWRRSTSPRGCIIYEAAFAPRPMDAIMLITGHVPKLSTWIRIMKSNPKLSSLSVFSHRNLFIFGISQ